MEAYRIITGAVEIVIGGDEGGVLAVLGEDQIFGEMGLIDEKPRSATARAMTDTEVEVVDEASFISEILTDPGMLGPYLTTLVERLRMTDALLQVQLKRVRAGREEEPLRRVGAAVDSGVEVKLVSRYGETGAGHDPVEEVVKTFPYRIGRDHPFRDSPLAANDLYLKDENPFHVSRNHCSIELHGDTVVVRDRGSALGTLVNGEVIGIRSGTLVAALEAGENTVVLGDENSRHVFSVSTVES